MERTKFRALCAAGVAALLLAGGLSLAVAQESEQMPEWQEHDQLDERYGPLAWLTFGEVIGSQVVDQQGGTVGEITGLVRAKSDGMFYAVMDTDDGAEGGDEVVPVDHLEVTGESEQARQIVLVEKGMTKFDKSQFEAVSPQSGTETSG